MSSSRVGVAIDALVSRLTAAVAPVPVREASVGNDSLQKVVVVGWDGNAEGDYASTSDWVQEWAGLGQLRKDEMFSIICAVSCWTGDVDAKARRDEALALLGQVEDNLRADPTLGVTPQPFVATFAAGQLFQEIGPYGAQARITFTVAITHNRI